ncbi:MAG: vWA domain-containing protein [Hyphomicrobiaceae bacterium]
MKYHVDLVLCIDCSGSMAPVIGYVKDMALKFHDDLLKYMRHVQKEAAQVRVKVIGFRDIYDETDKTNGLKAFGESDFFALPAQGEQFKQFVTGLQADGGGDEPENALEALSMAMKSPWDTGGDRRRHAIVMWTDAPAHRLENLEERPVRQPVEPDRTAATFDQLTNWWHGNVMDPAAQRLALFAPDTDRKGRPAYPWPELVDAWDRVYWFKSKAGKGLSDMSYSQIMARIAQSVE